MRLTLSWGAVVLAVLHACAMVGGFYVIHEVPQVPGKHQASLVDTLPTAPTGYQYQTLPQPTLTAPPVNRSALDEIKQQTGPNMATREELKTGRWIRNNNTGEWVLCNPCNNQVPTLLQPTYVQPSYVQPTRQPTPAPLLPSQPQIIPASNSILSNGTPTPAPKQYELALFRGHRRTQPATPAMVQHRSTVAAREAAANFQVYTRDNPLYKTRYANIVPPEQFLRSCCSMPTVHTFTRLAGTLSRPHRRPCSAIFQQGVAHSKQVRETDRQMTGRFDRLGTVGIEASRPTCSLPSMQYLQSQLEPASDPCPDGNCRRAGQVVMAAADWMTCSRNRRGCPVGRCQ